MMSDKTLEEQLATTETASEAMETYDVCTLIAVVVSTVLLIATF